MAITVFKDVLIVKDQLDRYFEGVTPVNLWRALNVRLNQHAFHFVEEPFVLSSGRPRPAHITIETISGQKWVNGCRSPTRCQHIRQARSSEGQELGVLPNTDGHSAARWTLDRTR